MVAASTAAKSPWSDKPVRQLLRHRQQARGVAFADEEKLAIARPPAWGGVLNSGGTPCMGNKDIATIRATIEADLPLAITGWCADTETGPDVAIEAKVVMINT